MSIHNKAHQSGDQQKTFHTGKVVKTELQAVTGKQLSHFTLHLQGFFPRLYSEILSTRCVKNAARCIDQKSARTVHSIFCDIGKIAALCTYSRNEQEIFRCN